MVRLETAPTVLGTANTKLTRFVARGLWVLLAMPTLSEDVESS